MLTLNRLGEARDVLHEVLAQDPTAGSALRLLADVELADDQVQTAYEAAQRAVSHDPSPASFLSLASTQRRTGDFAGAVASCERGLALDPDEPGLHVTLSLAWAGPWLNESSRRAADERTRAHQEATSAAARALELDPERPNAHYAAAVARLVVNDDFGAANALEPGLALAPDWAEGHLLMAAIRGRQGMTKLSSRHLTTAGRLNPADGAALGFLRRMGGKHRRWRRRQPPPWWLAPEARQVLEADRRIRRNP